MQKRNKLRKFLVMFSILSILSIVNPIFINKNNIINLAKNEKKDIKAITSADGKWEYVVIDETNKTVRIQGYIIDDTEKENETKLNIPSTIDEYIVISLDTNMLWGTGYIYAENCKNIEDEYITDITIPSTIIDVKDGNSYNQSRLQNIDVDSNNPNYASVDGVLYNKEKTKLIRCPAKKTNINIPSSVISIDEMALQWCDNLTSETIEKVKAINEKTNSTYNQDSENTNLDEEVLESLDKDVTTDNIIEDELTLSETNSIEETVPETVAEIQNILPRDVTDPYRISLTTGNNTIKQGESITISLNISDIDIQTGEKGIGAYKGNIEYDTNVFDEVKMSGNSNWDEPGVNKGIFASVNARGMCVKETQEVAKITLKAKSNATLGNTKVKVKGFEVSSLSDNMITTGDTSIDITINESLNSGTGSGSTGTGSGSTGTGSGSTGTGSGSTGTGSGSTGTGSGSTGTGSGSTGTGSGTTETGSGTTGTGSGSTGTDRGTTGRDSEKRKQDENKLTNSTTSDKKIPFAGKTVDLVAIISVGIVIIITIYAYIKYEKT